MPEALTVSLARTPIGRAHKGSLAGDRADDLATQIAQSVLSRVPALDPGRLADPALGASRHTGEQSQNLARRVAVQLGLDGLPGVTVNRDRTSSLQAVRMAAHAIRAGEGEAYLAAGVESVSRYRPDPGDTDSPLFEQAQVRAAECLRPWTDPREVDALPDVYIAMGQTAENVAGLCGVTREDQDQFALRSQQRTAAAVNAGHLGREITPYVTADGTEVVADDSPRPGTTLEGLGSLKPVFRPDGSVTAGNSCPLNDGASAAVLVSDGPARELQLEPLARVVATAVSGISPELLGGRRAVVSMCIGTGQGMAMAVERVQS